jgi:ankyrin repeat protein
MAATTTSSSGGMNKRLLKAAISGDSTSMRAMASQDRNIFLGKTPQGNNCLHISSIHGHNDFCKDVLELEESLLAAINLEGETPLMAALTNGHVSVASFLLRSCCQPALRQVILQQDRHGYNGLHHAIRNGHKDLALQLVTAEPALSEAVSKCNESPMFFAVMRGFTHIYDKLMQNPDCAYSGGQHGCNCLHAAVRNGDRGEIYDIRSANYMNIQFFTC